MSNVYLEPSEYGTEIVGEQSYQKTIKEVIMYDVMVEKWDMEYSDTKLTARIVLEDNNKFDPGNAVRIDIDNKTVGYLSKEDAAEYRKQIESLGIKDAIVECKAGVFGKRMDVGKQMKFGVWVFTDLQRGIRIGEKPKRKKLFGIF